MVYTDIISYCCGSYDEGNFGGVARYDHQLKLIFPKRKFFQGPAEKRKMLIYLRKCENPLIITDNHLSIDIPNKYDILLVHHGSALTHAEREPTWNKQVKDQCCGGQSKMLSYRKPEKTKIISCSSFCKDEFTRFFPELYPKFDNHLVLHPSELDEDRYKKDFSETPKVLGNWSTENKGSKIISKIKGFEFCQLKVSLQNGDITKFNNEKQDIYLAHDIFLQISLSEGNSYATLDALICGLPIVASNVGLFYKDVPEDCFIKMDWRRNGDHNYVRKCLQKAWENKETLSRNSRRWYMENCRFIDWEKKMKEIVNY